MTSMDAIQAEQFPNDKEMEVLIPAQCIYMLVYTVYTCITASMCLIGGEKACCRKGVQKIGCAKFYFKSENCVSVVSI